MSSNGLNNDKKIIKLGIAGVLLLILLASYFYDPVNYTITDCSFRQMTGLSCPSCGLTRSFHALAHFHLSEAFGFHLLGPVFFTGMFLWMSWLIIQTVTGNSIQLKLKTYTAKMILGIVVSIWIVYWVFRMLGEIRGE